MNSVGMAVIQVRTKIKINKILVYSSTHSFTSKFQAEVYMEILKESIGEGASTFFGVREFVKIR